MTPDELIAVVHRHWPETLAGLDADERRRLHDGFVALQGAELRRPAERAVLALHRVLRRLPAQHPVGSLLHSGESLRYAAPGTPLVKDRARLADLIGLLAGPPPTPEQVLRATRERLLQAPARRAADLPPAAAHARGAGGLLRLRDPDHGDRYPEFQFAPGTGELRPVVCEVNRILLADEDPWGAAEWWLGGNAWLNAVPADLLGTVPDHRITLAARALVEGQ